MKSKWQGRVVLALEMLAVLAAAPVIAAEKVYINGIDANFPPFAYVDKVGKPDGFEIIENVNENRLRVLSFADMARPGQGCRTACMCGGSLADVSRHNANLRSFFLSILQRIPLDK